MTQSTLEGFNQISQNVLYGLEEGAQWLEVAKVDQKRRGRRATGGVSEISPSTNFSHVTLKGIVLAAKRGTAALISIFS
jgi:hypothetical protein